MTKAYILLLLTCTLFSCAQQTEKINIKGTKVFIEVLVGFKSSKSFIGLEKSSTAMIQISDMVGGNFYSNAATFSKKAFEDRGIKVFDYQELKIDGYPAKYAYVQGQPGQKMISLVFGDSTFCDMAMAILPANDEAVIEQVKKAFLAIQYKKQMKVDYLDLAYFKVEKNKSVFKFAKASANMFLYSKGGVVKDSYKEESMIMILPLPSDNTTLTKDKIAQSLITGLTQNSFVVIEEKNIQTSPVNGFDAYEIEVSGFMKGQKALLYLLVLTQNNQAIGIEGIAYSNFEQDLVEFKEMAHHVVFK